MNPFTGAASTEPRIFPSSSILQSALSAWTSEYSEDISPELRKGHLLLEQSSKTLAELKQKHDSLVESAKSELDKIVQMRADAEKLVEEKKAQYVKMREQVQLTGANCLSEALWIHKNNEKLCAASLDMAHAIGYKNRIELHYEACLAMLKKVTN
jgi:hypothetical protein